MFPSFCFVLFFFTVKRRVEPRVRNEKCNKKLSFFFLFSLPLFPCERSDPFQVGGLVLFLMDSADELWILNFGHRPHLVIDSSFARFSRRHPFQVAAQLFSFPINLIFSQRIHKIFSFPFQFEKREPLRGESLKIKKKNQPMVTLTLPVIIPLENTLKLHFNLIFSLNIHKTFLFSFKSRKKDSLGR